jgi:hypothetical protein
MIDAEQDTEIGLCCCYRFCGASVFIQLLSHSNLPSRDLSLRVNDSLRCKRNVKTLGLHTQHTKAEQT